MKMKLFTSIISLIILGSLVLILNPANAAPGEGNRDGFDKSRMIEHRIDRLTMILADKQDEGIDITKAEDFLLEAIELFDNEKYDDALIKLEEVEKSLGIERRNPNQMGNRRQGDGMFNQGGEPGMQDRRHQMKREFSDEEKEEMLGEINDKILSAQRLIKEGNLEEAFHNLSEAQRRLGQIAGIPPPPMHDNFQKRRPDNQGGQFRGGPDQRRNDFKGNRGKDQNNRGSKIDPEVREKLQAANKSIRETVGKYIEENEKDEFIDSCIEELKSIGKELRSGEIDVDKALELIKSIEKKIHDNM